MTLRLLLTGLIAVPALAQQPSKEDAEFYTNKILPIFAENCYKCHSAEGGKDKGGLTLDTRDAMLKGGDTGPSIVPGDLEKSLLIKAVSYTDPELQMPPKGDKLSAAQVADLKTWVKSGAVIATDAAAVKSKLSGLTDKARHHWAYQPVAKPAVPVNKNQQWCYTAVDAFILQKLEAAGMYASRNAEKETRLRRVTYDLTGLPPTPAEIQAYITDPAEERVAWSKVVDRLLASKGYGERWARHWLDTARYSDTAGANADGVDYRFPHAWTYRDWVINAFNDDMPYDQFVMHQLAADYMPKEQQGKNGENLAALGFITIGERFGNPNDVINERIDTVSKGFLALTVACARCHDHMFDPISQKDYYSMHGMFSSITEPKDKPQVGDLPPKDQYLDFANQEAATMKEIRDGYFNTLGKINEGFRLKTSLYFQLFTKSKTQPPLPEDAPKGTRREPSPFTAFLRENKLDQDTAQAIERRVGQRDDKIFGPFARLAESEEQKKEKWPAILAEIQTGVMGKSKKPVNPYVIAAFKAAKPPQNIGDVWQVYEKVFGAPAAKSSIWLQEIASSSSPSIVGVDENLTALLQVPMEVKPGGGMTLTDYRAAIDRLPNRQQGNLRTPLVRYNQLQLTHPGAPAHAMIVADKAKATDSPVFIRGQANVKGEIVPRRFLEILSPGGKPVPFTIGSGRYEFAKDIASKDNPLTARVLVNRVWMHHFGEGFVPTPDDLGTMSEKPTHPELLDYLASYLMENKWSIKQLHRLILNSRVYIESSETNKAYVDKDPYNKLLWRAPVRRLDFESVRDSLLVFSGNIDRTVGGKPINLISEPYSFRRSVYGYVDRGNLPELMAHFDFSKPDMSNSKRTSTVVPQQALFLMNSSMTVDVVRRIVARPEFTKVPSQVGKIRALYEIIFQRYPSKEEYALAEAFLKVEAQDTEANAYVYQGTKRGGGGGMDGRSAIKNDGLRVSRRPLTPWETFAQALLLSNESAYVN